MNCCRQLYKMIKKILNEGIIFLNYLHDRKVNELLYINAKFDCIELNNFFPELQQSGVCLKNDALL